MSTLENLLLGAYRRSRQAKEEALERIFGLFPRLAERRRIQAGLMSGGEQQMLAMARALMGDPKLLLLDEPTVGLAPAAVSEAFRQIEKVASMGVSLVIVDQNAMQAMRLADDVCVVRQGQIVYRAPKEQALTELNVVDAHLGIGAADAVAEGDAESPAAAVAIAAPARRRFAFGRRR